MWNLWKLLFSLSAFLTFGPTTEAVVDVFAYVGGEAHVSCSYPSGYVSYVKYLCQSDCGDDDILVTTQQGHRNRYSIHDDSQSHIFTAIISNVEASDAGRFWCGVSRTGKDIYTEVKVHVRSDRCCDSVRSIQAQESSVVSMSCPFQDELVDSFKYMCRLSHLSKCRQQALVTTDTPQNGRLKLEEAQSEFTVKLTGVTKHDAGSYLCGIERNNGHDEFSRVELVVKEWCCANSRDISGLLGQSVTLQCPYPAEHRSNRKFLCKGENRTTCQTVVTSSTPTDRFRLQDEGSSFSVTITGLRETDAGTYWCGSDPNWTPGIYTKVQLSLEWCCANSHDIRGLLGQSVTLQCPYPAEHRSNRKFLCKGENRKTCQTVVTSSTPTDRFRLQDEGSSFSVTITGLRETDAGTYWCGSDPNWTPGIYTKVRLSLEWCCANSHDIRGLLGQSVTLQCPYPAEHRSNRKFLCKGENRKTCQTVVTSSTSTDRFRLQDEGSSFSVTITGLRETDTGTYWCGSDPNWTPGIYTKVQLSLEWCCANSRDISGLLGQLVTLQCPYPAEHRSNRKFLCKGENRKTCQTVVTSSTSTDRFRLQDGGSSFSVTITGLRETDAGTYWCGSDPNWTPGIYTKVQLSLEWCCANSYDISGLLGQSVTLQCPYPAEHRSNRKFLCKGENRTTCQTVETGSTPTDRFRLQDEGSSFSVTITGLRETDAGAYWCGSDPNWTPGIYTKVRLSLDAWTPKILLYVLPGLLVILGLVTSVIIYKCCCARARGGQKSDNNCWRKEEQKEEHIAVDEIYCNQENMRGAMDNDYCHGVDQCESQDEVLYENFADANIYGNC